MEAKRHEIVAAQKRCRKLYRAVVARLGGVCAIDRTWIRIVDYATVPCLIFGSHLWDIDKSSIRTIVESLLKGNR